jgi:tRNA-specific 2-thiouridylase
VTPIRKQEIVFFESSGILITDMTTKRVFVAMSGGVDSSIAAYLLKQQGYDVSGVNMVLTDGAAGILDDSDSALDKICRKLEIPLHKLDLRREFDACVQDYFFAEYGAGRTPNPCVVCNRHIKFGLLLKWALAQGADYLATGHYVRVEFPDGIYHLLKGTDRTKDQSYFLYRLDQSQLSRVLFPIGTLEKTEVKNISDSHGLVIEHHSRDVCFIPGDTAEFIARHLSFESGEIVDRRGNVLGVHDGLQKYTIGQRRGFGVSASERLYVLDLDIASRRLVVGSREELKADSAMINELTWISGHSPESRENITAKIRYRTPEVAVSFEVTGDSALVEFYEPQFAVTPGQSLVFYRGDEVLGGGIIVRREVLNYDR